MIELEPHEQVAANYMAHKGYPLLEPYDVEKLEDQPCWYFLYELDEGILELEIFWNGSDWEATVTTFTLAG